MSQQTFLYSIESLLDVKPLHNFEMLFANLEAPHLDKPYVTGRKPFFHQSLLKAIIFKNLKGISGLRDLCSNLKDNPSAAIRCGFDITRQMPSRERFSAFLNDTPNPDLQKIRLPLVQQLAELGIITGEYLSIDSCAILAKVKENNLKTNLKDRFNKERICKGDPDARLGVIITFPSGKKKACFFWGYRDHVIIDTPSELPLWQITKPANVHDSVMFIPMFDLVQKEFHFDITAVMADGIYDCAHILKYIINDLKAKPRVSRNPRNFQDKPQPQFSKTGNPFCDAGLEMLPRGNFYDKSQDRWRSKWVCPLHHSKKYVRDFLVCPMFHPKFFSQKGCYLYIRTDEDIRNQIDYGSTSFKHDFNKRSASERVFSRLLDVCLQDPPVIGLKATVNYATIAHITVLLVALTAARNGMKDKIRFIKSFLPNFHPS